MITLFIISVVCSGNGRASCGAMVREFVGKSRRSMCWCRKLALALSADSPFSSLENHLMSSQVVSLFASRSSRQPLKNNFSSGEWLMES
jgi:hypothetical protein